MGISVRLRGFIVLVSLVSGLSAFASALAADAFDIDKPLPKSYTLAPRAQPARPQTPQAQPQSAQPQAAAVRATEAVEPICDIFANGYDLLGATPCAGCFDGTLNFQETDVDCGGTYCKACADGKHCAVSNDCSSGICNTTTTVCAPATCADNVLDGTETDTDCGGGVCPGCAVGKTCHANTDCASSVCDFVSSTCVTNQCFDQRKDGTETDVDCGGGTCQTCAVGEKCMIDNDCTSGACDANSLTCTSNQCADHQKDGAETDVDCGGGVCPACAIGLKCKVDTDCVTPQACDGVSLTCVTNQCFDHRKDGMESDIDCGGLVCNPCPVGDMCNNSADCQAGHACISHMCQ